MAKNKFAKIFNSAVAFKVGELSSGEAFDLADVVNAQNFEHYIARPCEPAELHHIGFAPIYEGSTKETIDEETGEVLSIEEVAPVFADTASGNQFVKVSISNKKIPKKEVDKIVKAKMDAAYADAELRGEKITATPSELKAEFKHIAELELVPKLFSQENEFYVWFHAADQMLYVSVPTYKKAEEITTFIRAVLGSLPITRVQVEEEDISDAFTGFITNKLNNTLVLGDSVVLKEEKESVTVSGIALSSGEVDAIIAETGYKAVKLNLENDGVFTFTVNESLEMSGIKYDGAVTAEGSDEISTFILCAAEIRKAFAELASELGGFAE